MVLTTLIGSYGTGRFASMSRTLQHSNLGKVYSASSNLFQCTALKYQTTQLVLELGSGPRLAIIHGLEACAEYSLHFIFDTTLIAYFFRLASLGAELRASIYIHMLPALLPDR